MFFFGVAWPGKKFAVIIRNKGYFDNVLFQKRGTFMGPSSYSNPPEHDMEIYSLYRVSIGIIFCRSFSRKKLMSVVIKTRDSTTSKICAFLLTLIAHVESGQILLFVESLVLSTTIY